MAVMFTASGNLENADLENRDLELKHRPRKLRPRKHKRDFVACLSGIREIVTTQKTLTAAKANQPGERQISIESANLHLKFISFCRN